MALQFRVQRGRFFTREELFLPVRVQGGRFFTRGELQ